MKKEKFDEIANSLDANDKLIFATLMGVVPVAHPLIIQEAWRHVLITGLHHKIDSKEFAAVAFAHLEEGILISHN